MVETPTYGFPLERLPEPPGHTLRVDDGFSPTTLGEAVETELERIDAAIVRGWHPIDHGTQSGLSFDVDPGRYSMIRVHMVGQLSALGFVTFRCNNQATAFWESRWINFDAANGGAVDSHGSLDGQAQAVLGRWSTRTSRGEFTIYGTDGTSQVRPYRGEFTRSPTGAGNFALVTTSHGRTANNEDLITSIQIVPRNTDNTVDTSFNLLGWYAEGYIP